MLKIGSHVGNSGDLMLVGSVKETLSYKANCFMVYMGPPQSTYRKPASALKSIDAVKLAMENGIDPKDVVVHAPYIVNLGQSDPEKFSFAIKFLTQEVVTASACGFKNIVLHPGAHVGMGSEYGINRIAEGVNQIIENTKYSKTVILFETMAGKGTECGRNFEEISKLLSLIYNKERIGVCLDTCHIHDAGYDIVNNYDKVIEEFDRIIGLKYLKVIHVNDSKNPCGSHKDRHENIGFGQIGFDTLMKFIYDERFESIPKILETPYIDDPLVAKLSYPPYKHEIEMIRKKEFDNLLKKKVIIENS